MDGKINAAFPLVDLLWSVSGRATGKGVMPLSEKPMESMRMTPSIAAKGIQGRGNRDGKGKARPSGPSIWLG